MSGTNELDKEIEEVVKAFKTEMKMNVTQMSGKYNFDFAGVTPVGTWPFKWNCKCETFNSGSRW